MKRAAWIMAGILAVSAQADAAVRTRTIEYRDGDKVFQGYAAYDDALKGPRPGVMIVHEWKGLGPYAERRARELAALGYVAFAADIYGKGVRPQTHEEAGAQAGLYKKDRRLMRQRATLSLGVLRALPDVDGTRLAAIGYCFGGTTVLELARSGADVRGVASFHGSLDTPDPKDAQRILGKVRVFHGAADPYVPKEQVRDFEREMNNARVDYKVISYPKAVHSFTVPEAGKDPSQGVAYDEAADKHSWKQLQTFLKEIFTQQ